ncbi:hypothetical protein H6P81_014637 [Aristolochia fimbriata]|uniref:Uncharacterized protein n=1 Tax=Aristolochia fimbriata TaxID=158543 RepID=A0AAV7E650_ARIFI|nr:hypothetical protein H6P81_014637 [Aristolochia fimbriata]
MSFNAPNTKIKAQRTDYRPYSTILEPLEQDGSIELPKEGSPGSVRQTPAFSDQKSPNDGTRIGNFGRVIQGRRNTDTVTRTEKNGLVVFVLPVERLETGNAAAGAEREGDVLSPVWSFAGTMVVGPIDRGPTKAYWL